MSSQEIRPSSTERLSHRHEDVWEQDLAYEIRALKLFARCTREEESRIVCGDKSGWITCFSLEEGERAWEARAKGPVYDLSFIHPLQDGVATLDPRLQPCLVAAGTGNGELVFFDYLNGDPGAVDWADPSRAGHFSKEAVLALLYVESLRELWVALSGGTIERLCFCFSGDRVSVHLREPVEVDEAVSSLCFMPGGQDHPAESYSQGWICAATMLGNLYRLDHHAESPAPQPVLQPAVSAPIRTALPLSRVLAEHGSEGDALVFAYGGNIKYFVQKWKEDAKPGALDRSCADRVLCLGRADWKDSVWLIAGANDAHLHFYRLLDSDALKEAAPKGKGLLNLFADRRYTIRFEERVLKVVGRDRKSLRNGDSAGLMVYVALGNHQLKAIRLLPREEFRHRLETALGGLGDLKAILKAIRCSPDDSILRRNLSALLFRARWLSGYVKRRGRLDPADQRRLRLVIYHLLSGIGVGGVREILSGILEIANDHPSFRREATDLARHIGKYCLDGRSFSDKSRDLDKLAKFNEDNGCDYIYDAAIYRSLLAERHYTEQEVFQLDDPITSLQSLEVPGFGSRFLLATSYWKGRVWLLDRERSSTSEIIAPEMDGKPVEKVQRAVVWKEESSSTAHVIFFYFRHGWTSCPLEDLGKSSGGLEALRPLEGVDGDFYAYSCLVLPGGLIAAGGRTADVGLLRVAAQESGGLQLAQISRHPGGPPGQTAPVRALAYRPLGADFGELFAGCDNGACYLFPFENGRLREPQEIYPPSTSKIRVVACHGLNHLVIGDGALLVLLRRPAGETTAEPERLELIREWAVRLRGPVTGAVATTLRVPPKEPCLETDWDDRQVVLVSDSEGVINVLRLGDTLEHSFAARLDGGQPLSIEYLAPLASAGSPEPAEKKRTQVAVACLDQTVRILTLSHRRESVRRLNHDLAAATAANLVAVHGLPDSSRKAACGSLQRALDTPEWGIPQIAQAVVQKTGETAGLSEQDVRNALEKVAWKLASAHVQSESPGVLALRLRYDDPEAFGELLKQLNDLSLGEIVTPEGKRPHIRLRYCLRFAFKILAQQLWDGREVEDGLREQMAHLVDLCHELTQSWGPESSEDNLRCKLDIVHMLCRFATPQSLEWLLGEELKPKTYHPLIKFLEDRVLNDPRLVVPFRAVQHIRRMIDHDFKDGRLEEPVLKFFVPLLVERFRNCRATQDDAWIGAEIYLCLLAANRSYGYSPWTFVASLLREGCPPPLLELLADRQRAHPPDDERCCEVVEALSRIMNLPVGDPQTNEVRRVIFERLEGIEKFLPPEAAVEGWQEIFISLRALCAVAIAFDTNSSPDMRVLAHEEILTVPRRSLVDISSTKASDLQLLLRCAKLLLRLSPLPPRESFETVRPTYLELKRASAGLLTDTESDSGGPDVVRTFFLTARELLLRQIQIELDFVAPIRFLQERSFVDEPIPDEEVLARQLRGYAALHGELSESLYTLFFYKDSSAKRLILEVIGQDGSREVLHNRGQVRRRIDALLEPWGQPDRLSRLKQEVDKLLKSPQAEIEPVLEPFPLDGNHIAEIIPIHRESQPYGLLVFLYGRNAVPDPSKRALSRMVFQLLVSEFMRSVQTQRLLSLTFHHISSPVSAMRAMLKAMLNGHIPDSGEYLEELQRLAEDCRLMIDNHLNYMRIVRGIAPPIIPKSFDLVEEAEFRRRIIQRKSKGSKQILRWASKPETLSVRLDQMMVGDIIQNLLDNASKYSPAQSEILLTVRSSKKDVFIEVSDAGPGLPEHVSASLYGEGVRGESNMESKRPGLGLGLYMVHRYADWLDGAVWFETKPKSGTTFTVRLPREIKT